METSPRPHRANVLLIGPAELLDRAVELQATNLLAPVMRWRAGEALVLPSPDLAATLILNGAEALTPDDQTRLFEWLATTTGRTQVVSLAAASLWTLVTAGRFRDDLYYRLNVVRIDAAEAAFTVGGLWVWPGFAFPNFLYLV